MNQIRDFASTSSPTSIPENNPSPSYIPTGFFRLFEFDHSLTTLFPESECGFSGGKNNFTDVTKIELGKKKTSLGEYPWVALIGNG